MSQLRRLNWVIAGRLGLDSNTKWLQTGSAGPKLIKQGLQDELSHLIARVRKYSYVFCGPIFSDKIGGAIDSRDCNCENSDELICNICEKRRRL